LQHYQQLVDGIASQHPGMKVVMHPPMLSDRPLDTAPDTRAAQVMAGVLNSFGLDSTLRGVPFCSDASKFGAIGIPSIILGPGSIDQAHASVEYIDCEQVIQAMQIYRQFIVEFQ
jgi:acetylornithine deacetylase